jgi:HK97 family phage major capsid protein
VSALNDELIEYLYTTLRDTPAEPGVPTWAMSAEWLREIRSLTDSQGYPLWHPGRGFAEPTHFMGYPIEVREDAGAPRIEFKQ